MNSPRRDKHTKTSLKITNDSWEDSCPEDWPSVLHVFLCTLEPLVPSGTRYLLAIYLSHKHYSCDSRTVLWQSKHSLGTAHLCPLLSVETCLGAISKPWQGVTQKRMREMAFEEPGRSCMENCMLEDWTRQMLERNRPPRIQTRIQSVELQCTWRQEETRSLELCSS